MRRSIPEILLAAALFWILALMVIPLPPAVLDLLLSFSLTLALMILLLSLFIERPLDLSIFPTVLLMVTLLRLGLNVASTRLILLRGAEGPNAAGNVIQAFGGFTVAGNYVVGMVVFLIFIVINFVVITKGAGRIAEVAARFTLDAMPGKQMAIDADLNQGVVDDAEAKKRRSDLQREAEFYGAMDGASKFVRGDAIAGLLIMFVNIVGGLLIGVIQEGMPLAEALRSYTILTVGDGLVSQVPALVISTGAGIVVSRAASGAPLAQELREQMILQPRSLTLTAAMLGLLAIVPGLPFAPFALLGAGTALAARAAARHRARESASRKPKARAPAADEDAEVRRALTLDDLELEIGYGLIPLVDPEKGGELLSRIRAMRKQLAAELGFVVPLIHIRDNLQLESDGYAVLLRGSRVASGRVPAGRWLALGGEEGAPPVPGIATRDPAFGLPALWIQERDRERASAAGYAVVDASTSLATHLAEIIRTHGADLLSRQHVRELVDQLATRAPRVVEEIVPNIVSLSVLHRTLRNMLNERVSIRDLATILETLAEHVPKIQDPDLLTDLVRQRLARAITRPYTESDGSLNVLTLAPDLEEKLRTSLHRGDGGTFLSLDGPTLDRLVQGIERAVATSPAQSEGRGPVLLASQAIRAPLRQIVERLDPRMAVIAHNELPRELRVVGQAVVGAGDAH